MPVLQGTVPNAIDSEQREVETGLKRKREREREGKESRGQTKFA